MAELISTAVSVTRVGEGRCERLLLRNGFSTGLFTSDARGLPSPHQLTSRNKKKSQKLEHLQF